MTPLSIAIKIEFDYPKRDSRLASHGGVVLQRFEFIKVCMGTKRFCWKSQLCPVLCEKSLLTLLLRCILCCLPAP